MLTPPDCEMSCCVPLVELGKKMARDGPLVLIAMGDRGVMSRVLPRRFGSAWSYAGSIDAVGSSIPEYSDPSALSVIRSVRSVRPGTWVYSDMAPTPSRSSATEAVPARPAS